MDEQRRRWPSGRGIRLIPKTKRLLVKGLLHNRKRVSNFFRLLRSWCCWRSRTRPSMVIRRDGLYYTSRYNYNSFYDDAIEDCIAFIKRST